MDYPQGLIERIDVESLGECLELCIDNMNCDRVVALPSEGYCLLKNSENQGPDHNTWAASAGAVSVDLKCISVPEDKRYKGDKSQPKSKDKQAKFKTTQPESEPTQPQPEETQPDEEPKDFEKEMNADEEEVQEYVENIDDSQNLFTVDLSGPCVEKNVDYPGGQIDRIEYVTSMSQCLDSCEDNRGCVAFTVIPDDNSCLLKNRHHYIRTRDNWTAHRGAISVVLACLEAQEESGTQEPEGEEKFEYDLPETCMEHSTDYPGGYIRTVAGIMSLTECQKLCLKDEKCVLVVVVPSKRRCILKNKNHDLGTVKTHLASVGSISIPRNCNDMSPSPEPPVTSVETLAYNVDIDSSCLNFNTDIAGELLLKARTESLSLCRDKCFKHQNCEWIVALPLDGTCLLKLGGRHGPINQTWYASRGAISASMRCLYPLNGLLPDAVEDEPQANPTETTTFHGIAGGNRTDGKDEEYKEQLSGVFCYIHVCYS